MKLFAAFYYTKGRRKKKKRKEKKTSLLISKDKMKLFKLFTERKKECQ